MEALKIKPHTQKKIMPTGLNSTSSFLNLNSPLLAAWDESEI
jgi:hypothetical protein